MTPAASLSYRVLVLFRRPHKTHPPIRCSETVKSLILKTIR